MAAAAAAAVLGGGVALAAAPSIRCCSCGTVEGGSFASGSRHSYVGSAVSTSGARLASSTRSFSSPCFMGGAGVRFGSAARVLRRFWGLQMQKPVRKGNSPSSPSSSRAGSVAVRAVWKQEILWADSPVAEVEKAAESLFHVVLDISGNPELIEGHTKPGQFVQVSGNIMLPTFLP
jgi:hypothetical protein